MEYKKAGQCLFPLFLQQFQASLHGPPVLFLFQNGIGQSENTEKRNQKQNAHSQIQEKRRLYRLVNLNGRKFQHPNIRNFSGHKISSEKRCAKSRPKNPGYPAVSQKSKSSLNA